MSQPPSTSSVSEAPVTEPVAVVAPIPIESAIEPQGQAATTTLESRPADPATETAEQTQTTSPPPT